MDGKLTHIVSGLYIEKQGISMPYWELISILVAIGPFSSVKKRFKKGPQSFAPWALLIFENEVIIDRG